MIIRLVKWVEVEVDTDNPEEAKDIIDAMDNCGGLEFRAEYYNAQTEEQLN